MACMEVSPSERTAATRRRHAEGGEIHRPWPRSFDRLQRCRAGRAGGHDPLAPVTSGHILTRISGHRHFCGAAVLGFGVVRNGGVDPTLAAILPLVGVALGALL